MGKVFAGGIFYGWFFAAIKINRQKVDKSPRRLQIFAAAAMMGLV